MNLRNLFKKPEPVIERTIVVVKSTRLRLEDWCSDPSLIRQAREVQDTPIFQAMMAVLRYDSPMNSGLIGANADDRIVLAAQSEGYQMCLNNLEALATPAKKEQHIESTFKPE